MTGPRRILVTGATGFIGRHVVTALVAAGHDVTCAVRNSSEPPQFPLRAREAFAACKTVSLDGLDRDGIGFDQIIHLAAAGVAPNDRDYNRLVGVNVVLGQRLAALAHKWRASMVVAGSCSEYQPSNVPLIESAPLQSEQLYGATKAAGTLVALATANALHVPILVCRIFGTFGAGEADHRLMPALVRELSQDRPVRLSPGTQVRDLLWVVEVARALVLAADAVAAGPAAKLTVNICSGRPCTIREFAEKICALLGRDCGLLDFGAIPMRPDDLPYQVGSPEAAASVIGFTAAYDLDEMIRRALKDFVDAGD